MSIVCLLSEAYSLESEDEEIFCDKAIKSIESVSNPKEKPSHSENVESNAPLTPIPRASCFSMNTLAR